MKIAIAACVVTLVACGILFGQTDPASPPSTSTQQSGATGSTAPATATLQPAPYQPDEFPQWTKDLRRGEIITVGVFPFAYLVTNAAYDLGRFLFMTAAGNSDANNYAPWFFAPPTKPQLSQGEIVGILVGSIAVSALVAVLDYAIGKSRKNKPIQPGSTGP